MDMCFLLTFLLVSFTFQTIVNQDISGALQSVAIGPGDIYNFNVVGQATAAPTESTPTLAMTGGTCTINGNQNTVTVSYPSWTTSSRPAAFGIITGGSVQLTIKSWTYSADHKYVAILLAQNAQQITLTSCRFTGTACAFLEHQNVQQSTLSNCTFENIVNQFGNDNGFNPLGGSVLTIINGGQFTLTGGSFTNVTTAKYSANTGATGFGAPVFIASLTQATLSGVSFTNCSGAIAGAVLSCYAGTQNTFTGLKFAGNSLVIPDEELIGVLSSVSNPDISGPLVAFFGTLSVRGNDITRIGSAVTVTGACSTSPQPHYRNASATESFEECRDKDTAAPLRAPSCVLVLLLAMAALFLSVA